MSPGGGDMARKKKPSGLRDERAVYIISVAAELAGVHPQTLRFYERKGLLSPKRTAGNTRRYSDRDIMRLQAIQKLTQAKGINLAGAKMIMEMEQELDELRRRTEELEAELIRKRRLERERGAARRPGAEILPLREMLAFPWDREASS